MKYGICGGLLTIGLLACQTAQAPSAEVETHKEALLAADRAFDRATAAGGVEGWVSYFAEKGAMFPADGPVIRGHEAIREAMAPLDDPGFSLSWEPLGAEVSSAGDLGYTYGRSRREIEDAEGNRAVALGKYVTIWKKQADGSWKVVVDIGNEGPPEE
jgi:ketosteroid isomerase-like protein